MFPLLEIESFYAGYTSGKRDVIHDLGTVAELTENWLLGFSKCSHPFSDALNSLHALGANQPGDRLSFAIGICLSAPSANSEKVLHSYQDYIQSNTRNLTNIITDLSVTLAFYGATPEIRSTLQKTNPDAFDLALTLYSVKAHDVIREAIAWDDFELFIKASNALENSVQDSDEDAHIASVAAFNSLAMFEVDTQSRIHRHLVKSIDDEMDLFGEQMQNLRSELACSTTNSGLLARQRGARRSTLLPCGRSLLAKADSSVMPIHRRPEFKLMLHRDLERTVREFFSPSFTGETDEKNGPYADEITRAFLDAGVSPGYLIAKGPCHARHAAYPVTSDNMLLKALEKYVLMEPGKQRFFATAYRVYLEGFSADDIAQACKTPEHLAAAYRLTGEKQLLQAGTDHARSLVMSQDLGL